MKNFICSLLLIAPLSASSLEVGVKSIYADRPARLMFTQGTFSVESEDGKFDIPSYNIRGSTKGLDSNVIESLLLRGDVYFKLDCKNQVLDSNLRMRGGMPPKQQDSKDEDKAGAIFILGATATGACIAGPVGAAVCLTGAVLGHSFNKAGSVASDDASSKNVLK